jgi:peptide/nickel transport system permease protein
VAGLPGLGRLMVDSITRRDYTMLQGAVIVAASFTVLANFVVDIVYVYLDPRIRLSLKGGEGA